MKSILVKLHRKAACSCSLHIFFRRAGARAFFHTGYTNNFIFWQVTNIYLAQHRQQMMLTQRRKWQRPKNINESKPFDAVDIGEIILDKNDFDFIKRVSLDNVKKITLKGFWLFLFRKLFRKFCIRIFFVNLSTISRIFRAHFSDN